MTVAFRRDGKTVELAASGSARHSTDLAPLLEKLLRKVKSNWGKVDCVAVGLGPGSFTGLRVGLAFAKTLCRALDKKIIGVPSFEAVAIEHTPEGARSTVCLDAKKGKIYAAVYARIEREIKIVMPPCLTEGSHGRGGPRAEHPWETEAAGPVGKIVIGQNEIFPRAKFIAELAQHRARRGDFDDPYTVEPLYLYPRDCNVTMRKK